MSSITTHIRVLRAEAAALAAQSKATRTVRSNAGSEREAGCYLTAEYLLDRMATAKTSAADALMEQERALAERLEPRDGDVRFDPKGKAPGQ